MDTYNIDEIINADTVYNVVKQLDIDRHLRKKYNIRNDNISNENISNENISNPQESLNDNINEIQIPISLYLYYLITDFKYSVINYNYLKYSNTNIIRCINKLIKHQKNILKNIDIFLRNHKENTITNLKLLCNDIIKQLNEKFYKIKEYENEKFNIEITKFIICVSHINYHESNRIDKLLSEKYNMSDDIISATATTSLTEFKKNMSLLLYLYYLIQDLWYTIKSDETNEIILANIKSYIKILIDNRVIISENITKFLQNDIVKQKLLCNDIIKQLNEKFYKIREYENDKFNIEITKFIKCVSHINYHESNRIDKLLSEKYNMSDDIISATAATTSLTEFKKNMSLLLYLYYLIQDLWYTIKSDETDENILANIKSYIKILIDNSVIISENITKFLQNDIVKQKLLCDNIITVQMLNKFNLIKDSDIFKNTIMEYNDVITFIKNITTAKQLKLIITV